MLNYRTKAIFKREIRQQIFSKKFIIMTLSIPVIMLIVIGLQVFIATFDREERATLHIVNESAGLQALVRDQIAGSDLDNPALYELHYTLLEDDSIEDYVDARRQDLLRGGVTGIVFVPDSARDDKQIRYYSTNPANQILQGRLRELVNRAVVAEYFANLDVDPAAIQYARTNVDVEGIRVTSEGNTELNFGNLAVAFGFTMLIYISLLGMGPAVMGAVNEEKNNKVVEVLLSAATTRELIYGKIAGTALAGMVQMLIWISPVVVLSLLSLPALAALNTLELQIGLFEVTYFLLNYLMGVLAFMSIFAAFGAMFDNPQDAQGAMMPVMMLIIIPFALAFSMARNPANALAEVSSMLPFASILVMPARMSLIDVPLWQIGVAILVNLATIFFCVRFGAKLYRITILMSGKKPSWAEMYKWLRYE